MKLTEEHLDPDFKHQISSGLVFFAPAKWRDRIDLDMDVFLPSLGMNLQRGLVWDLPMKQAFVWSILTGQHLAPFTVIQDDYQTDRDKWEVVDGKQRLSAYYGFLDGEFPVRVQGRDYYFEDLAVQIKLRYTHCKFLIDVHYNQNKDTKRMERISDETKVRIFERINWFGRPQELEHIQSLRDKIAECKLSTGSNGSN